MEKGYIICRRHPGIYPGITLFYAKDFRGYTSDIRNAHLCSEVECKNFGIPDEDYWVGQERFSGRSMLVVDLCFTGK